MEREFIRVRSAKDIFITLALIISGTIMVAWPDSQSISVAGFFTLFAGILLWFVMKTGYKDTESGKLYQKKEHYFAQSLKHEIATKLATNLKSIDLNSEDKGNGLRLDVYYSKATGKAYIQLFEYIPHTYEPCSQMYEHSLTDASEISKNHPNHQ